MKSREEQLIELGAEIKRIEDLLAEKRTLFSQILHKSGTGKLSPKPMFLNEPTARKIGEEPGTHAFAVLHAFGGDVQKVLSVAEIAEAINWKTTDVRFNSLRGVIGKLRQAGKIEWAGHGKYRIAPPSEQMGLQTIRTVDKSGNKSDAEAGYTFYDPIGEVAR